MPRLLFYRGPELLLEYRLRSGRTCIGRADTCDVALVGDAVSRTHCLIDGDERGWRVTDRSRHGTTLNEQPIDRSAPLADGDDLGVGRYRVTFQATHVRAAPTADAIATSPHELLVRADDVLCVERAVLVVTEGPAAGREVPLRRSLVTVGGVGSDIEIQEPGAVARHCRLRVSRGRVMLAPGEGPTYLNGRRIVDITPIFPGEELAIGSTRARVDTRPSEDDPTAAQFGDMVGESRSIRQLFGKLRRFAAHDDPLLILGESGTGKELAARGIHTHSHRSGGPFVAVNCGAITTTLFESELFGHEKGAFTGAHKRHDGAFHRAHGGTLFLDEIGELPLDAQAKLLRALESGEVRRVGSIAVSHPNVRVIAATNRNLVEEVQFGGFRADLFFRLGVLIVEIPPLKQRVEDLDVLCATIARSLGNQLVITPEAMDTLKAHDWPGNVRELRNVLARARAMGGPRITRENLSFFTLRPKERVPAPDLHRMKSSEKGYLEEVLQRHNGNRAAAARELGIARSTLLGRLKRLGII